MRKESIDYNQLLIALKAFELEAFEILYLSTRERLFAYSFSILKDEDAAQDLVQVFFIDFWENKIFLNINSGLIGYIMMAVRNRSMDYLKKEKHRKKQQKGFEDLQTEEITLNNKIINQEMEQEMRVAMSKLPPMPAKVFHLHYIEKLSYKEISAQLNISPSTISNHISRALKILRQELKKN